MKYAVVIAHVWFCFILSSGTSNTDDNLPMSRHLEVFTFTKLHGFNKSTLLSSSVKGSEHMQLWTQIINIKKSDKTSVDWFKVDLQLFNMTELSVTTFAYFLAPQLQSVQCVRSCQLWHICLPLKPEMFAGHQQRAAADILLEAHFRLSNRSKN